jgi:SprT protein
MNVELIVKSRVSDELKNIVKAVVSKYLDIARNHYNQPLPFDFPVYFDTIGRAAAFAHVWHKTRGMHININPVLLNENMEYIINQTVPHEVAHLVAYLIYGKQALGHGYEWRSVMSVFGLEAIRCHRLDTTTIKKNRNRTRFNYTCKCGSEFDLSLNIVNKLRKGQKRVHSACKNYIDLDKLVKA